MFSQHHMEVLILLHFNYIFISVLSSKLELFEMVFFTCVSIVSVLQTHLIKMWLPMVILQGKYYLHFIGKRIKSQRA